MAYETSEMIAALGETLDQINRRSRYAPDSGAEERVGLLNDIIELAEEAKAAARSRMMELQKSELDELRKRAAELG
jgi:hypothetical protein